MLKNRALYRISSLFLLPLLLPIVGVQAAARAGVDRPQATQTAQSSATFCDAEREYFLSSTLNALSDRANQLPQSRRSAELPPILLQMLQLVEQYQSDEARLNMLQSIISWLYELTAEAAGDPDQTADLEPMLTQIAALIDAADSEYSAVQSSLLVQLARHHLTLQQPDSANQRLARARQAIATLEGSEQRATALLQVTEVYVSAAETEQAIATLHQAHTAARQLQPRPDYGNQRDELLGGIARLFAQLGEFEQAIALTQSMQAVSSQGFAQTAIVESLLKTNQSDTAMQLAQQMTNQDQQAVALSAIGAHYAAQGDANRATSAFRQALAVAQQVEPHGLGTYGGYVSGYVLGRYGEWQPDLALALARSLPQASDRVLAMIPIALTYQQQGETAQSSAVIAEAIAVFQTVDPLQQMNISNFITYRLVEMQQYDWLFQLAAVSDYSATNLRESTLHQIIFDALNRKQIDAAIRGIAQLPADNIGRIRWLDEAIAALVQADQLDRAEQLVQDQLAASSPAEQVKLLGTIALHYHQAEQTPQAAALLQQAAQITSAVADLNQKAAALVEAAAAHIRVDQPDRAAQFFAEAMQLGASRQGFALTQPLVSVGQYDWAFQLAQTVPTGELMTPEPINVVSAMLSAGAATQAEALIPTTQIPEVKTQLFLNLADYYITNSQLDRAATMLTGAIAAARTIPGPEARLTMVMGAGAYDYNDPTDRASQFETIALRYAHLGQFTQVAETIALIESPEIREAVNQRLRCEGQMQPN